MTSDKTTVKINISKAQKEKLKKITESENITQAKLIEKLIDIYDEYQELKSKSTQIQSGELDYDEIEFDYHELEFDYDEIEFDYHELEFEVVDDQDASVTENEIEIVAQTHKNSNLSWQQIVKDSLLQLAKYQNSITKNQPSLDSITNAESEHHQFSGVTKQRITKAIETIRKHNEHPGKKSDKYCITKGIASVWIPEICC